MASYSESEPVFDARCLRVGIDVADVAKLKAAQITSLAKVAFCSSYTPGSGDDTELIEVLKQAIGGEPSLGTKAAWRRLFHESFAATTSEMKQQAEATGETQPRRISVPERAERFAAVTAKLKGFAIRGRTEPSDALIDASVGLYESNRLCFIEWDKLTSKEAELAHNHKRESFLSLDKGKLKSTEPDPVKCDTSSEMAILNALQRRGVAFEMANLLEFERHSMWVDHLMNARLETPPPSYCQVTLQQLLQADRRLFQELADRTRTGIQSTPSGRPLDAVFETCVNRPEVLALLQPLPKASSSSDSVKPAAESRWSPYSGGGFKGIKGARKGKGKGKSNVRMPAQIVGCTASTNSGASICFGFNLKTCKEVVQNGACVRGLHICAVPRCGKHHPALDCPMKPDVTKSE